MIALIGALCMCLVFLGGSLYDFHQVLGLLVSGLGASGLGALFAAVRLGSLQYQETVGQTGLILQDLQALKHLEGYMPVYVECEQTYVRADHVFTCRLNGERALVLVPHSEVV